MGDIPTRRRIDPVSCESCGELTIRRTSDRGQWRCDGCRSRPGLTFSTPKAGTVPAGTVEASCGRCAWTKAVPSSKALHAIRGHYGYAHAGAELPTLAEARALIA